MDKVDRILDQFTDPLTGSVHGAVFIAIDSSGKIIYHRASGKATPGDERASALQTDALYWVASLTKLATAVAVMQLVERGMVSLEDDVRGIIPELRDIQILEDMKSDQGISREANQLHLKPVQGKITLRSLLCHTAGFVYDSSSPLLQAWSKSQGRTAYTFCGSIAGYQHPLLFEPDTSWGYGAGLDWAGQVVERLTNSTLEEYMQTHIWSKLGATSTTFHPELHRATLPPQMGMGHRVSVNQGIKSMKPGPVILQQPAQDDLGGIGLFSTPMDFVKLLSALLRGGDTLLARDSVDHLLLPQLSDASREAMPRPLGAQMRRILGIKDVGETQLADHALTGTVALKDIPGRRRAGTVNWSGLPNLHWWIDRQTGIAATLFTQVMPPGDAAVTSLLIDLEEGLYAALKESASQTKIPVKL
ncbi:beta-lactamase/transpeptidase-like protein [Aspergillus bertholletiae]|uniref:Beta-lactamase/transpeptidase-like protein n=1 Tax=Aspergillus bertholletiae TaxID=1226010 RepID=A0A5N7AS92_9EURO|nr:beta-lactamase/transpeptidase-like protein [Aspergillus bertholletiae]